MICIYIYIYTCTEFAQNSPPACSQGPFDMGGGGYTSEENKKPASNSSHKHVSSRKTHHMYTHPQTTHT